MRSPARGTDVELTATEYRLLRYFMLNPRLVLTRAQLLDHVWDYDFGGDARVLETYVSYLRKKLDVHGAPLSARGRVRAARTAVVMASLRARLIAGLLVLAALGLLLLGGITYAEQRSFLLDRVDQQARAATRVLSRALDDRGFLPPGAVRGDRGVLAGEAVSSTGRRDLRGRTGGPARAEEESTFLPVPTESVATRAGRCSGTWRSPTASTRFPRRSFRRG